MAMLTPLARQSIVDAQAFRVDAGGAESNVAAHAVHAGVQARWFSRLGDDALGRRVHRIVAGRGVDVSTVEWDRDAPTGMYVKDPGAGVRYYRSGSAASRLAPRDVERLRLDDVAVLHLSGITPALSASAAAAVEALMERARADRVLLSFDVNHRPALWSAQTAADVLRDVAQRADLVFIGLDEATRLWGSTTAADLRSELEVPSIVVKDGAIGATLLERGAQDLFVPAPVVDVVEEVGAGDAFAGGYLAALIRGLPPAERLAAGHAQAGLALVSTSDFLEETPA
jgi:2-dehydro-3-deoxygluconokinase